MVSLSIYIRPTPPTSNVQVVVSGNHLLKRLMPLFTTPRISLKTQQTIPFPTSAIGAELTATFLIKHRAMFFGDEGRFVETAPRMAS